MCISFPLVHPLLVCSRHSCPFTAASEVKSFVSSPFPLILPTLLQVIILLGSLLSSLRTTCPYRFNMLFSILFKTVCVTPIFSLITSYSVSPCSSSTKILFCPYFFFPLSKMCTVVQALRLCTGRTAHRGSRGIALPFHDHGTRRGEASASRPGRSLPPEKTQYPLYRRLDGPHGRSGQVQRISPLPGSDPRTVQPVASRYTD
jgi:hypothetical protein